MNLSAHLTTSLLPAALNCAPHHVATSRNATHVVLCAGEPDSALRVTAPRCAPRHLASHLASTQLNIQNRKTQVKPFLRSSAHSDTSHSGATQRLPTQRQSTRPGATQHRTSLRFLVLAHATRLNAVRHISAPHITPHREALLHGATQLHTSL